MRSEKRKAHLVDGPVHKLLINMTIPMIFGMLSIIAFNLIDTYFVSKLGTKELAAMSFTFPIVMIVASISLGLGIGASATISRAIGEGNRNKVVRLTTDSLILSFLIVVVFVALGLALMEPTFRLLGAPSHIYPLIKEYMVIWYASVLFLVIPMVGNNAIRATGDTKTASVIMLLAMLMNLILDPLLIFGIGPFPRLELAGAAIATVISRIFSFLLSMYVLYKREKMIEFSYPGIQKMVDSWKQVLYISLSTAGANLIIPISTGIIIRIVADYGPEAVAAFGVASRIDMIALIIVMALHAVIGPFVGQNIGARKFDRLRLGIRYSQQFAIGWGLLMGLILALSGRFIGSLFSDNELVISIIADYLWIVPAGYSLQGVLRLSCQALNVLKKPLHSAVLSSVQAFVIYIPLAWAGSELIGLKGIFGAAAISYILSGIAAYSVLKKMISLVESSMHTAPD
ncbi:MAG: MATE family efflux transporter [Deltaproteobacteria bacterium]|nr:MATE family efflux transporter [Deltaproteobacteria bacterium]